jgi:5'-nucleotidase
MLVLVTNDDGILAPALRSLREALRPLGRVVVVAPDRDQSATSHSLTLHRPFRIQRHEPDVFSVDGTPTDCVVTAWYGLLDQAPDLVVSGVNHGPNMGEDVFYSGTVAAAIEGTLQGAPSIAASLVTKEPADFAEPAAFVARLARRVVDHGLPHRRLLNVNLPHRPRAEIRGVQVTRLGSRTYRDTLVKKTDPRGRDYYWIGGEDPEWQSAAGTDHQAVHEGFISVTPMRLDLNDADAFDELRGWDLVP